jgi:hypothetical protein
MIFLDAPAGDGGADPVKAPMSAMLAVSRGAGSAIAGSSLPGSAWKS